MEIWCEKNNIILRMKRKTKEFESLFAFLKKRIMAEKG